MKFKLDENISKRAASLLDSAGHDVSTVLDEELSGARDKAILEAAVAERRALITLDRDFGNVLQFPPRESHGIVILETAGFTRRNRSRRAFAISLPGSRRAILTVSYGSSDPGGSGFTTKHRTGAAGSKSWSALRKIPGRSSG